MLLVVSFTEPTLFEGKEVWYCSSDFWGLTHSGDVEGQLSLVPRPLPAFQCRTTLKSWEWPGDEARSADISYYVKVKV